MKHRSLTSLIVLVLLGTLSVGCSPLQPKSWSLSKAQWWKEEKLEPQVPSRLVTTWTDTVLHRPGESSKRGFGGRILFFNRESEIPVPVEGQLVVYAYDESQGDPSTARPTRRYIFPAEQFGKHHSECSLGSSYSVWIPWDEVGGPLKNVSLIARFEPLGGPLIVGEQTSHLLPGQEIAISPTRKTATDTAIQLTSYQDGVAERPQSAGRVPHNNAQGGKELKTTSIQLPQRFQAKLSRSALAERLGQHSGSSD